MITASRLVDWKRLRSALGASRYDAGLVLLTAFAAVFISVEFSILIGVGISILLFVPRAAKLRSSELIVSEEAVVRERVLSDPECTGMLILAQLSQIGGSQTAKSFVFNKRMLKVSTTF